MLNKIVMVFLMLALLVLLPSAVRAEDNQAQSETEVAAAEDAQAAKMDAEIKSPLTGMLVRGQYIAQADLDETSSVLGYLKNKEHAYLVKAQSEDLRKELAKYNGKEISVEGKERNNGKYLILVKILPEDEKPQERRKRRGF